MTATLGADSEVGRLRTVMLHRPGPELQRLTPRNNDSLLFDGIPWVGRAQDEHDAFAQALRDRDVEVLYLVELLVESLQDPAAREQALGQVTASLTLGDTMRAYMRGWMRELAPEELATALTAGVRNDEVRGGFGLVTSLMAHDDFLVNPLPNLLFTRDSSVWLPDRVAVTSLAMPARARETQLTELIYQFHSRFAAVQRTHGWKAEHLEGGDVLLLGPGVIAIGAGERTTPAGVERFARYVFANDLAHTVLAVPIAQERATMHLDTVCTMVDTDAIVMYPNVADTLVAHAVTCREPHQDETQIQLDVAAAEPFLVAAAKAMRIDTLRQIDTGLDPVTAEREQWDDGNNTLAIAPRVAVAYERNVETNARLMDAGIEVVAIAGSELSARAEGGPAACRVPSPATGPAEVPAPQRPADARWQRGTRAAVEADVADIAQIWHQGYRDAHLGYVPEEIFEFRRLDDFRARVPGLLDVTAVAEVDSVVVGFVMVEDDELNQIYVAPAARGHGAAGRLLRQGEDMIAARFERGWLAVVEGNARARRFYERAGWHEAGPIAQPSYAGPGRRPMIPALRYEKSLRR